MGSSNEEMYMPQPFGDDPEHKSTMDPVNPEPLEITQPKEDGNQFTGSKKVAIDLKSHIEKDHTEGHNSPIHQRIVGYYGDDHEALHSFWHNDDLQNFEDGHSHGPDGQTIKESSKKLADRSNTDESGSPGGVGAPKHVYDIDVEDPPEQQLFGDAGETSRGDGSITMLSSTFNPEARKIVHAYVAENGAPKCSVCENYYTPKSIAEAKLAHCGHCPEDNPDANKIEEGDVVDGDVVKTSATQLPIHCPGCGEPPTRNWVNGSCKVCGYQKDQNNSGTSKSKKAFKKFANDSELYTRGYLDHLHGKPLDEDLAVLSDDYFNGYDQARFYGKTPLESVGAKPHKVTQPAAPDGSLEGWEPIDRIDHRYDVDRSKIIASTLPTNVLEAFFNTEE
jgi:uncharacterized Zn finger protein (UPF0148 family)